LVSPAGTAVNHDRRKDMSDQREWLKKEAEKARREINEWPEWVNRNSHVSSGGSVDKTSKTTTPIDAPVSTEDVEPQ
jgi:hypothetical protein